MGEVPLYPIVSQERRAITAPAPLRFRAKKEKLENFKDFELTDKAKIWPGLSSVCHIRSTAVVRLRFYLTLCIYQLLLESQLPPKIVNLLFTITHQNAKLTILWGN